MRKLLIAGLFFVLPTTLLASGGGVPLMSAHINTSDTASLQRGARTFVNYCLSCHEARAMRYNRMGEDLGINEDLLAENLMFASRKTGDPMKVAMRSVDAAGWFGTAPPDLSVISRSRGADWLYTYLMTFYLDPSRPLGVNNLAFPDVGMPHVLWKLQGWQALEDEQGDEATAAEGHADAQHHNLEVVIEGQQSEKEYEKTVRDLVNFMVYLGEPARLKREAIGPSVILFLLVLLGVSYLMKLEWWKDIH